MFQPHSKLPALSWPHAIVAKKNQAIGPKRWNFGEGYGIWGQPGALKGGIPEKEIAIFEL